MSGSSQSFTAVPCFVAAQFLASFFCTRQATNGSGPQPIERQLTVVHGRAVFSFQALEPAERELLVEVPLDAETLVKGIIDRVDVAPGGQVRIVDYKSSRAPNPLFEQRALFQMRVYALLMWRQSGHLPDLLQLIYLADSQIVRLEPDEDDLRALERTLNPSAAAITKARETGDFRPSPSRLCNWCQHRALCPASKARSAAVPADRLGSSAMDRSPGGLVAEAVDLVKVYGDGGTEVRALDGVSVGFAQRHFTAIMGPSGSGKSTLMHCMAGLDTATSDGDRPRCRETGGRCLNSLVVRMDKVEGTGVYFCFFSLFSFRFSLGVC